MQSVILGLGAYLAIERLTTVGAIFAGSLLLGRALQPIEQVVASWRNLVAARGAYRRVRDLLPPTRQRDRRWPCRARPAGCRSRASATRSPGSREADPAQRRRSGSIPARRSASSVRRAPGKSTLARHLVGVLAPTTGAVRLDDADVSPSGRTDRSARYLGYLPQDIELFADTVAANISRFADRCRRRDRRRRRSSPASTR